MANPEREELPKAADRKENCADVDEGQSSLQSESSPLNETSNSNKPEAKETNFKKLKRVYNLTYAH